MAGGGWLLRGRTSAPFRFLGVAVVLVLGLLVAMHAKPYYLAPAITPLFAAGSVTFESWVTRVWARSLAAGVVIASALPAIPMCIPILPINQGLAWQAKLRVVPERLENMEYSDLQQHLADQLGWSERVSSVTEVVQGLSAQERAQTVLYTTNYGRAASLELLGSGLPPVVSGHNQYFLWGVQGSPQIVVALGGRVENYTRDFQDVKQVGQTPNVPHGMPYESEIPIYVLKGPRAPLLELFRASRHFE
jgi:hypothetical protein